MRRTFTVELTTREALTVHRMARLSGVTPDVIVQTLYRSSLFDAAVSLATGVWEWFDDRTHRRIRNRKRQFDQFVEYTGRLLQKAEAVPEPTIRQQTGITPRQA
ncbi:hypothetical protein [Methylobacterium sp. GC_Met_2]|uniref:hypothetical protein n=1 Tax=Methylobacterium sp. GC_Met_2 TaxID=2937376 RepID=UPI00226B5984|nr:hypothetical protein [Methylobacterium sp. GC_Met_2]